MATPITLKKIDEQKSRAQTRFQQKSSGIYTQILTNPYANSGQNYTRYRQSKQIDFTSDSGVAFGRQFTSFEQYNPKNKSTRSSKIPQLVVAELDNQSETDDYIINPKNIISFRGAEHFLSPLYQVEIVIAPHTYKSVEHYYQACKLFSLAGSTYALPLQSVDSPLKAKVQAKKILTGLKISKDKIDDWKQNQGFFMYQHAMIHKFVQHRDLRQQLLDTGDDILVQAYDLESFFACGMTADQIKAWANEKEGQIIKYPSQIKTSDDIKYIPLTGKGKNVVGVICMKIRKLLRDYCEQTGAAVDSEINVEIFLPKIDSMNITESAGQIETKNEALQSS